MQLATVRLVHFLFWHEDLTALWNLLMHLSRYTCTCITFIIIVIIIQNLLWWFMFLTVRVFHTIWHTKVSTSNFLVDYKKCLSYNTTVSSRIWGQVGHVPLCFVFLWLHRLLKKLLCESIYNYLYVATRMLLKKSMMGGWRAK